MKIFVVINGNTLGKNFYINDRLSFTHALKEHCRIDFNLKHNQVYGTEYDVFDENLGESPKELIKSASIFALNHESCWILPATNPYRLLELFDIEDVTSCNHEEKKLLITEIKTKEDFKFFNKYKSQSHNMDI